MARTLSSAGISTFLVPDSSIYAIMSRVNKVIIGAHAILANGGLVAIAGALLAATAARAHSTPVVVCAGQFKLTPLWNLYHDYGALDFADPSSVLGFEEGKQVGFDDGFKEGYERGRREERVHAMEAFDKFLDAEKDRDSYVSSVSLFSLQCGEQRSILMLSAGRA